MQPFVTNYFVEKAKQWHFYIAPSLRTKTEAVFEEQGVTVSEGFARLAKLLVESPHDVRLLLLKQAKGDAAVVLAESVLRRATDEGKPLRPVKGMVTKGGKTTQEE